jgi:putative transcriptional regulator
MKEELFTELMESVQEALAHAKGKRDLKTTILPSPPKPMHARDVRKLRSRLRASQAVFASYLNVSTKLVQAWEADRRTPEGAALRLLRIAESAPELLLTGAPTPGARRGPMRRAKRSVTRRRSLSRAKSA